VRCATIGAERFFLISERFLRIFFERIDFAIFLFLVVFTVPTKIGDQLSAGTGTGTSLFITFPTK
jgi:hypothetical protein